MSTPKLSKMDLGHKMSDRKPPKPAEREAVPDSPDIEALNIDVDSFESGDPYNRTGQFLVEHLRRTQSGK